MKKLNLLLLTVFFLISCRLNNGSDNPEITAQEIKDHITYLASDELKGRFTGSEECKEAADYIKKEFDLR